MAVTITVTPTNPRAIIDTCRIDVAGASSNDASSYDDDDTGMSPGNTKQYPEENENRFYLLMDNPSGDDDKSYEFNVSEAGAHEFNNFIFPNAGSWTVRLRNASNDSDVQTQAVTVS